MLLRDMSRGADEITSLLGLGDPESDQIGRANALAKVEAGLFGGGPVAVSTGPRLSRYVLLERVGSGGFGTVYLAYDPELDRRVAIKLLHTETDGDAHAAASLVREARALARFSHPNVVSVYDIRQYDTSGATVITDIPARGVFLVMELVDGISLSTWLQHARSWREIVPVFIAAGRGLAAAHAHGLVHRDFKASNVLLSRDGRVLVADFGLAQTEEGLREHDDLAGTPTTMAPEQIDNRTVDARADQFAFCASLYRALHGAAPYPGDTIEAQTHARRTITPPTQSPTRGVPPWLHDAVRRGLAIDPTARFASMDSLLEAIDPTIRQRRRLRTTVGLVLTVSAGAAYGIGSSQESRTDPCGATVEVVTTTWNPEVSSMVMEQLDASGPAGNDAAERVTARLDRYADELARARRNLCEQASDASDGVLPPLSDGGECLDECSWELRGLVDLLLTASADTAENAVSAASALSPPEECVTGLRRFRRTQRPDRAVARELARLRPDLSHVISLLRTGSFERAREDVESLVEEATRVGHGPFMAEVEYWRGAIYNSVGKYEDAVSALSRASWLAEEHRLDDIVAHARIELVYVVGYRLARIAEADLWAQHARAAIARLEHDRMLTADLLDRVGTVHYAANRLEDALAAYQESFTFRDAGLPEDDPERGTSMNNIGTALGALGRHAEARLWHERAVAFRRRVLGDSHSAVASSQNNLGVALRGLGRYREARNMLEHSLATRERTLGANHPMVAVTLHNLGDVLQRLGHVEAARTMHERGLEIRLSVLPDHPDVAASRVFLCGTLATLGAYDRAEVLCRAALEARLAIQRQNAAAIAATRMTFGELLALRGQCDASAEQLAAAFRADARIGGSPRLQAQNLVRRGRARLRCKDWTGALADAEAALALMQIPNEPPDAVLMSATVLAARARHARKQLDGAIAAARQALALGLESPSELGDAHYVMTFILAEEKTDPEAVQAHALAAREAYGNAYGRAEELRDLEAWLARAHTPQSGGVRLSAPVSRDSSETSSNHRVDTGNQTGRAMPRR